MKQEILAKIQKACLDYNVSKLYLFGSRAEGIAEEYSDYDFLVVFKESENYSPFKQYFGLLFYLEDTLGCSVDLVCYDAIRNQTFKREIDSHKQEIYAA